MDVYRPTESRLIDDKTLKDMVGRCDDLKGMRHRGDLSGLIGEERSYEGYSRTGITEYRTKRNGGC